MSESHVPPPSSSLLEAVAGARPVRTRRPLRTLVGAAAASALAPAALMVVYPLRADVHAVPAWWLWTAGGVWAIAFAVLLARAVLPPVGQVLPSATRAGRAAAVAVLGLIAFGLFFTIDSDCCTTIPPRDLGAFATNAGHCLTFGLRITVPVVLVGALLLRKLALGGGARLGMAVGAAGGALGGLTLHLLCAIGGGLHVGFAHGGGVLLGAALGALVVPLVGRLAR